MEKDTDFSIGIRRTLFHYELRTLRNRKRLSQEQTAEACGLSLPRYQHFEQLRSFPKEEEAIAIAEFFEVDPYWLFPKWSLPIFRKDKVIQYQVVKVKRMELDSPHVLQLAEPKEIEEQVDKELLKKTIANTLSTLKPKHKRIIEERFGLIDDVPKTYDQVGRIFGVTRERIRQLERKALQQLRHPVRRKKLQSFL